MSRYRDIMNSIAYIGFRMDQALNRELAEHGVKSDQARIIMHIGSGEVPAGDMMKRDAYAGTNMSYNLKALRQKNHIAVRHDPHDERRVLVRLTESGLEIRGIVEAIYARHARVMENVWFPPDAVSQLGAHLTTLRQFINTQ